MKGFTAEEKVRLEAVRRAFHGAIVEHHITRSEGVALLVALFVGFLEDMEREGELEIKRGAIFAICRALSKELGARVLIVEGGRK